MPSFYQKNRYDVEITIGSYLIDTTLHSEEYGLCDELTITAVNGNSRTLVFSFIPPEETFDLWAMQGDEVNCIIKNKDGSWEQAFFGYVDTPHLSFLSRKITLECTDYRSNRIIQMDPDYIQQIGSYSEDVFGTSKDQDEELTKRLQTVAASFDFDRFGDPQLVPWAATDIKWTLTPADVYNQEDPKVDYVNHQKTINTINLSINYQYQRLHHQTVSMAWFGFDDFISDWYNQGRPTFPTKETVLGSAQGSDWKLLGNINFVNLWPEQLFGTIVWQPNQKTYTYKGRTRFAGYLRDGAGLFIRDADNRLVPQYVPVLDANNKQIMDVASVTITDTSSHLCRQAQWTAGLRFAQTINEKYELKIISPQGVAKFGEIPQEDAVNITAEFDTSTWEGSDVINDVNYNFYSNQKVDYGRVNNALAVSYDKARHDILELHRDLTVGFRTVYIKPEIDLNDMIDVTIDQSAIGSTAKIRAKAHATSIIHRIDFNLLEAYTEIVLRLSKSEGLASDTPFQVMPPIEDPNYIYTTVRSVALPTHLGTDPNPAVTANADKWTGWIANRELRISDGQNTTVYRTNFAENFIVDYPAIPDSIRNEKTYIGYSNFNVNIPDDYLETSF